MTDHGPSPYVIDIEEAAVENTRHSASVWAGSNLQVTVMSIKPGDEVGLEAPADSDQLLRIEAGTARVEMGPEPDQLTVDRTVGDDWAIFVPAGTWHNLTNVGETPLQVCSVHTLAARNPGGFAAAEADERQH